MASKGELLGQMICMIPEFLLCTLPNCSSKSLYQYSCQLAVYNLNLEFEGHCKYLFLILGKVVPNTFYKQFRACPGPEDTENRWALKRGIRSLNITEFLVQRRGLLPMFFQEGAGESLLTCTASYSEGPLHFLSVFLLV